LKVGLALEKIAQACRLRRSPGLAAVPSPVIVISPGAGARPSRGAALCCVPRTLREVREQWAMRSSGRGSTYSALQSRGGDGFFHVGPSVGRS